MATHHPDHHDDETNNELADLAGTGWHEADVEVLDERLPLKRYSVNGVAFAAGPRDDRPGRSDHGDGHHLGTESEGSSKTQHYALGDLVIDIEVDSQPGATTPRLRVRNADPNGE